MKSEDDILRMIGSDFIMKLTEAVIITKSNNSYTTSNVDKLSDDFVSKIFKLSNNRQYQNMILVPIFVNKKMYAVIALVSDKGRQVFVEKETNILKYIVNTIESHLQSKIKENQIIETFKIELENLRSNIEEKHTISKITEFLNLFLVEY